MNKKILFFLIIGTLATFSFVLFSTYQSFKKQKIHSPVLEDIKPKKPTTIISFAKMKEYKDPSGFKFNYPDNLKLETKKIEDQKIYSLLELTSSKHQGKIEIKVEDNQLTKIDDWFKNEATKPAEIKKIKLADIEGRQFELNNQILTIALDQGVLFIFTVSHEKDKNFWIDVNNKIIETFDFKPPNNIEENLPVSSENLEEEVIFEGEEIVE